MKDKFASDDQLTMLANEIATASPYLIAARKFRWQIIFVNNPLGQDEVAGRCKKIDPAIRYLWEYDYLILISRKHFDEMTLHDKVHLIAHELYHIAASEDGTPAIRNHSGDCCDIFSHDKQPGEIAKEVFSQLRHIKVFETQKRMEVLATA